MANSVCDSDIIRVDTWEKLFVFHSEFVAYNRSGMLRADPQSARWCCEKQLFDYTPFVTSDDWAARFLEQRLREINRAALRADTTPGHAWASSKWICQKEPRAFELSMFPRGMYGPQQKFWQHIIPDAQDSEGACAVVLDPAYKACAPYICLYFSGLGEKLPALGHSGLPRSVRQAQALGSPNLGRQVATSKFLDCLV